MAAIPSGMDPWRNSAVFEKTKTLKGVWALSSQRAKASAAEKIKILLKATNDRVQPCLLTSCHDEASRRNWLGKVASLVSCSRNLRCGQTLGRGEGRGI